MLKNYNGVTMKFKELLNESKINNAADDIIQNLLHGSVNKNTDINNFLDSVFKQYNINKTDKTKVIALVKKKYTGNLLDKV